MKTALVLACDDKFIPFTAVVARRIVGYAEKKFPIFLISDGVSNENKNLAQKFCEQIVFIEVEHLLEDHNLSFHGSFSRANYLRLFLDKILVDFERAVYLDSDISLLTDVSPLLAMEPRRAPVIAAYDIPIMTDKQYQNRLNISAPYFNSGVMIMDLKMIRADGVFRDALAYAQDHPERCDFVDQDALNAVLDGRWQVLNWRWNALSQIVDFMPKAPFLRHFTKYKPWAPKKVGIERRFIDEWRSDLLSSPWPDRFKEQSIRYPIKQAFKEIGAIAVNTITGASAAQERRRTSLSECLSTIERLAANGARAEMLPIA